MKKLVLNQNESSQLLDNGIVTVERCGFEIVLELIGNPSEDFDYTITIVNPYDKIVIKQELIKNV